MQDYTFKEGIMHNSMKAGVIAAIMTVAATVSAGTNDPVIQQRELNQQQRIDQGVQSGHLTPREAGRLEGQ